MFQTFEDSSTGQASKQRIEALRRAMADAGVDGFIVPRADEFQGEYVAEYAERLRWLTGFSGSAGLAIILSDQASIFVDGRYTVQVREQVDLSVITPRHLIEEPPAGWIEENLAEGHVLAYDPWLLTAAQAEKFGVACKRAGAELRPLAVNLVDKVWDGQPDRPHNPIGPQPLQFAGRSSEDKIADMRAELDRKAADAVVLTLPDSVAWVFNIRGSDISHTPVALAYAIVHREQPAELFVAPERLSEDTAAALAGLAEARPREQFEDALQALGAAGKAVIIDQDAAPEIVRSVLSESGAKVLPGRDPSMLPKATKNSGELNGARAAHLRDGVAMVRFLAWFDAAVADGAKLDEIIAARQLETFRRDGGELKDISFDSISGAAEHAAIPHYRVTTATNREINSGDIYLIDSGGQYQDGTTDITRTVIAGEPTAEMRDRFTRVLKGMINLSRARFPSGTTGGNLDVLARQALWNAGLDFDHGTGHGVGSYLSVHEGPARFSKVDATRLEPGMILSNEPGYYKPGEFGIRIENLVIVREPEEIEGGERAMMWLETLTLCPIDRRLIDAGLLESAERDWLNDYHARVLKTLGPRLDGTDVDWLKRACAPV